MHIIRTSHSIYKLQSVTSVTISDLVLSPNGLAGQQTIPDQTEIQSVNYVLIFFYRATLCVSAIFAVVQYLSVRLCGAFVYCIKKAGKQEVLSFSNG